MKFRILGPIEVTSEGRSRSVGGTRPRAILAALLLRRGEVVSTDALVHAAWGDDAPRDALGTLQAHVSRLRSVVDPSGGGALRYRAPGYVLEVAEDDLDATRFTSLVSRGLDHADAGRRDTAAELLGSALALWRGEPLEEFDAAYVDPEGEIARLHELRRVATEERGALLVRLGRAREVVAELEAQVRRHPERERSAVVLMEALYGAGRQADALAVYQRLRRHLVDDLGVEPSPSARRAHVKVLSQDPTLVVSGSSPPTNVPRARTGLVGRDDDATEVVGRLQPGSLVTLAGAGGVGKSRLALEVAHRVRGRFADGTWWIELAALGRGGPVDQAVATALGVRQHQGSSLEETLVEYLGDRDALVVLDNCEHLLPEVVPLVDRLLSYCPRLVVLTTSRERLSADGEQVWQVRPLPPDDAVALFVERARAVDPGHPSAPDVDVVRELCRHLEGLPLAIELAAARTRAMSTDEVLRRLDDSGLLVRESRTRAARQQSLAATIDWSYRLLTSAEQQLFVGMSAFAGSARLEAVHAVCGADDASETATLDLLTALADKSMVVVTTGPGDTRYRVLELLRAFGRDRMPPEATTGRRHAAYFTAFAEQAARGAQGPDEAAWTERVLPDVDDLRSAFDRALADREVDLAMRLCSALPEVLQLRVGYEASNWAAQVLELAPEDHPLFAATAGAAARGAWAHGDFERARGFGRRAAGRTLARGTARIGYPDDVLADTALYQGDVESALRHYADAVEAARADDDPIRLVWSLYYVAICHAVRRQPALGRAAAEESLVLAERTANPTARSMARYALGLVLKKEEPERALSLFDEGAALAASVHNFWWQGISSMEAAATRAVHEDPRSAARAFLAVLELWLRLGDRTQQWLNLRYVVRLLVRLGADGPALTLHHHLLSEDRPSPIDAVRLGLLAERAGEHVAAVARTQGAAMTLTQAVAYARDSLRASSARS